MRQTAQKKYRYNETEITNTKNARLVMVKHFKMFVSQSLIYRFMLTQFASVLILPAPSERLLYEIVSNYRIAILI